MTELSLLQSQLLEINKAIMELQKNIVKTPNNPSLSSSMMSLTKRYQEVEVEFKKVANNVGSDVLDYRLFKSESPNITSVTSVVQEFQRLLTIVYDALKNGARNDRHISEESIEKTSLNFGYTYPGSVGVVLTLPNDRLLLMDSDVDEAIKKTFELIDVSDVSQIETFSKALGHGTIKTLDDWTTTHLYYGIEAEIKWSKGNHIEHKKNIQLPELKQLKSFIEKTPIEESSTFEVTGQLVGIDVKNRTFHVVTNERDYAGKLSENITEEPKVELPKIYVFKIKMLKKVYMSKESLVYTLLSLMDV